MRRPGAFLALVGVTFLLRIVWPLADPPATLSWSTGLITDPAAVVHAAREARTTGSWSTGRELLFYPLMNALTWVFFGLFGVTRLATQWLSATLGTGAAAAFALAVRRSHGPRAGALAMLVLGTSFWLGMFARVPLVENLTALLLGIASAFAMGRSPRDRFLAALVGALAVFFGKAHAAPFLPALFLFFLLRERSARALRGSALAVAVVALVWTLAVLIPFREAVLDQAARLSEASIRRGPLAPLETIRTSWAFHRMPVVSAAGLFFTLQTLLVARRRRERLTDGSMLWPLTFLSFWLYLSVLPYQAPRYHVPAMYAFVTGAVVLAVERLGWARREGESARAPHGTPTTLVLVGTFTFLATLGLLEGTVHWATAADTWSRAHHGLPSLAANRLLSLLYPLPRNASLAAGVAVGVTFLLRTPALRDRVRRTRWILPGALSLGAALAIGQWATWAAGRSYALEALRASLVAVLPEGAVLQGAFAPTITLGTSHDAVPTFGRDLAEAWEESDATHLVALVPGDMALVARLEERRPGGLAPVRDWSLRMRHVRAVRLFARRDTGVPPSGFERAVRELAAGRATEAIRRLERIRRTDVPDHLSLEAEARLCTGDVDGARRCLDQSLRIRPTVADLGRRGELALRDGDRRLARTCWLRALALDPWDADAARALSALNATP